MNRLEEEEPGFLDDEERRQFQGSERIPLPVRREPIPHYLQEPLRVEPEIHEDPMTLVMLEKLDTYVASRLGAASEATIAKLVSDFFNIPGMYKELVALTRQQYIVQEYGFSRCQSRSERVRSLVIQSALKLL